MSDIFLVLWRGWRSQGAPYTLNCAASTEQCQLVLSRALRKCSLHLHKMRLQHLAGVFVEDIKFSANLDKNK